MFNFNEDGKNFLQLELPETIMLLTTIGIVIAMVAVCLSMFFAKRKYFKLTMIVCIWTTIAYAVALIIANLVLNWKDFSEMYQLYVFIALFIAVAGLIIFAIIRKNKTNTQSAMYEVKAIAYASICLAVSFALSYIKLFRMPQGGSVTLGSVMLLGLYSYMFGLRRGLIACLVYGILQSLQDPFVAHPLQFILDYPLAYTMFGFVALFKNMFKKPRLEIALGFTLAVVLRYLCHFFSGSIYFGEYGEEFGILNMWAWGAIYNLTVPIDGLIAGIMAVAVMSSKQVRNVVLLQGNLEVNNVAVDNNEETVIDNASSTQNQQIVTDTLTIGTTSDTQVTQLSDDKTVVK